MFRDLIGKGVEICNIGLQQGYIKEDGSVSTSGDTDHSKWVTTDFIVGGRDFICHLKEGFFINKVSVYDENFNLLKETVISSRPRCYKECTEYSHHLHKSLRMRLGIVHNGTIEVGWNTVSEQAVPDRDISPTEDIFEDFFYVDRSYFDVVQSEDPSYEQALRRLNHIAFVAPTDYKNQLVSLGVKYSDQNETPGRVGYEVSPYTYCTAVHNPRSVYWTENVQNHRSQYGWKYHDTNGSSNGWFGQNCSNSVDFVRGYDKALHFARNYSATSEYGNMILNATEVVPDEHCTNVKPLDNLVKPTHVWIVAEIWKDASGIPRFIRCGESGGGNTYYTSVIYSVESWLSRIQNEGELGYQVTRLPNDINTIQEPLLDYIGNDLTDDFTPIAYNDDICTFIGDKAEFMWGGIIYLNVHRYNGWENLVIEKWNEINQQYESFQTIDITKGSVYPMKYLRTSNDYTTGTAYLDTDWCDINISSYFPYDGNEYGKYRAYCTTSCKNLFDFAHTDTLLPPTSTGKTGYYLSVDQGKIVASSDGSHTWAIPCKPNTTYTVTQDRTNSTNSLLRIAYGTMANLDFVNTASSATVYSITNKSEISADQFAVTVTTGANATYLFVQVSATVSIYDTVKHTLVLREDSNETVESDPTYFEVLAVRLKCYNVGDMNQYTIDQINGLPLYITAESGAGFTNAGLIDSKRFKKPTVTNLADHFCWWGSDSMPSTSYPYVCVRCKGEYGYGKYETDYSEPTNYCDGNYYKTNTDLLSDGSETSNSYRDLVIVENLIPGDTYRFFCCRKGSASYTYERYAYYDVNDELVGEVQSLYDSSSIPEVNKYYHWELTVPQGAVKLKMGVIKADTSMVLYNLNELPQPNYYDPEYYTENRDLTSAGVETNNSYRNLVKIDEDIEEGDVFIYTYTRQLGDAYNYERYAFYDENGTLIGDNASYLYPTTNVPALGSVPLWVLTAPQNAAIFKLGALKGNSAISIKKWIDRSIGFNYYGPEYWQSGKDVSAVGVIRDSSYRNLVTIIVNPGEVYRYTYHRDLGSAYNYETYAFYDENSTFVEDTVNPGVSGGPTAAGIFYSTSSGTIPATGSNPSWELTVPSGCRILRIGALKGNSNISIKRIS